jgi:serine-type D-Ala-D-Ala carboxypeptidase/endopeptidase (penicillin-binding protein 4)
MRLLAVIALLALSASVVRAELPASFAEALQQAGIPETHVGIVVQEIGNPKPLLAHGEQRSLNPASVMKLLTTLVALDSFGPAHTFQTRIFADGTMRDGVFSTAT